jgi:hypothetical protein
MSNNIPDSQLTPNDLAVNNQDNADQAPQPNSDINFDDARRPKRTRLFAILIACIVIVIIACGAWYIHHRSASSANNTASITVGNEKIPEASCATAQSLIKKQIGSTTDDYTNECYVAQFTVGSEPIHYVIIKNIPPKKPPIAAGPCIDLCSAPTTTRTDYIVRASGTVQYAIPDWNHSDAFDMSELTGCGDGTSQIVSNQPTTVMFVPDKANIALAVTGKNIRFPDQYGDTCILNFKLTQDITNSTLATSNPHITQLAVHYEPQPQSDCPAPGQFNSMGCDIAQATLRNNVSLCSMTVDPTDPNDGDDECITSIAERRQDPSLCSTMQPIVVSADSQIIISRDMDDCQSTVQGLQAMLSQKLIVD